MTDETTAIDRMSAAVDAALARLRAQDPHNDDLTKWDTLNEPEIEEAFAATSDQEAAHAAWMCLANSDGEVVREMIDCLFEPQDARHLALCISLYTAILN